MSFWNSDSKHPPGRHVRHEARYDAFAGFFGRRRHAFAVVTALAFGLSTVHVVEADEKSPTPASAPAYKPEIQHETGRHIRVGKGVLERCNDTTLPVQAKKRTTDTIPLTTTRKGELAGNNLNIETLKERVQPALVRLEQLRGTDANGEMRVNKWNGVVIKDSEGRSTVATVGHGALDGDTPVTVTDAAEHKATVTDGCYIYQANGKALPIPTYPAPQTSSGQRETADIDLGIFYVDGPIGDAALQLATEAPKRGSFNMFANYPHGNKDMAAFTGMITSVHQPTIEYLTGIEGANSTEDVQSITPQLGSSGGPIVNDEGAVVAINFGVSKPLTPEEVTRYCGVETDLPLTRPVLSVAVSSDMIASALQALAGEQTNLLAAPRQ